jgi:ATP/maltotriose-dependent transcriptional regulator MalT
MTGELTLDGAARILSSAIPTLTEAGDSRGLARAEMILSNVHWFAVRLDELGAAAARAERHYRASGFSGGAAVGMQAEVLYFGAVPVADALARCAELFERTPNRSVQATTTVVAGALHALKGGVDDARRLLEHAHSLYGEAGNESGLLTTWAPYCIEIESIVGDPAVASRVGEETVERLLAKGDLAHASSLAILLGYLAIELGELDDAERHVRLVEQNVLRSDVLTQLMSRGARARLLALAGEHDAAEAMGRDAVALASMTDALRERARAHMSLAEVLKASGKTREARAEATIARRLLRQKGASALLERYRAATPAVR